MNKRIAKKITQDGRSRRKATMKAAEVRRAKFVKLWKKHHKPKWAMHVMSWSREGEDQSWVKIKDTVEMVMLR